MYQRILVAVAIVAGGALVVATGDAPVSSDSLASSLSFGGLVKQVVLDAREMVGRDILPPSLRDGVMACTRG
jgi:hypothetical protein